MDMVAERLSPDAVGGAMDARAMLPILKYVASIIDRIPPDDAECLVARLKHKPGKRSTILYRLAGRNSSTTARDLALIGKVYVERGDAANVYQRITALREGLSDCTGCAYIPAPLMLLRDLGMVLQEYFEGRHIDRVYWDEKAPAAIANAAKWLAGLHRSPPLPGLAAKSMEHELRKVDGWIGQIINAMPAADTPRLPRARKILHELASTMPRRRLAMIHRDCYHGNILCDGDRVAVIDFDQLSVGDPAMDIGHFLSHLSARAYKKSGNANALSNHADTFLGAYLDENSIALGTRLEFYKAYSLFKLAFQATDRRRTGWTRTAGLLADLACDEAERGYRNAS